MAWLLTSESVPCVNNVRTCCVCSAGCRFTKIPTRSWRDLRLRMTSLFLLGCLFCSKRSTFHLVVVVFCASSSDEAKHDVFSKSAQHARLAKASGKGSPKIVWVLPASWFPWQEGECYCPEVAWRWKHFAIVVQSVCQFVDVSHRERILALSWLPGPIV